MQHLMINVFFFSKCAVSQNLTPAPTMISFVYDLWFHCFIRGKEWFWADKCSQAEHILALKQNSVRDLLQPQRQQQSSVPLLHFTKLTQPSVNSRDSGENGRDRLSSMCPCCHKLHQIIWIWPIKKISEGFVRKNLNFSHYKWHGNWKSQKLCILFNTDLSPFVFVNRFGA